MMVMQNTFENGWENRRSVPMDKHFSSVSGKYRNLRTTDTEPVSVIVNKLSHLNHIQAVDVGCGAGRYDILFYRYLGDKLSLTCMDANEDMLKNLTTYLTRHGIKTFSAACSRAETMPFSNNAMDCMFTFNAIHHFNLDRFLSESARVLKIGGYLFVYTRLQEQNERNIWGQHFPGFNAKETRLFTLDTLKQSLDSNGSFTIESIVFFAYNRLAGLEQLLFRARSHHYSTFSLYTPEEFEEALKQFSTNIQTQFKDTENIRWFDENILLIIKKGTERTC